MIESIRNAGGRAFPGTRDYRPTAIYLALLVLALVVAASSSRFGRDAIDITSGDFALHMIVVESSFHNAQLAGASGEPRMGSEYMAHYPPWSHALVGYTAAWLGTEPLQAMQLWIAASLVAACLLVALRIAYLSPDPPPLLAIAAAALFLAGCAYAGFGMRGHVERNFFFPQFVGTVVAMAAFEGIKRADLKPYIAAPIVLVTGAFVIANFHLIPAFWFTLASLIVLVLRPGDVRVSLALSAAVGVLCVIQWTGFGIGGGGGGLIKAADTNGWFMTRFGNLAIAGPKVAAALATLLVVVSTCAFLALRRGSWHVARERLLPHAGLIAVATLIAAQSVAYLLFKHGSVYAITKYFYLLAAELAILVVALRWPSPAVLQRLVEAHPARSRIACVIVLFLAQAPFMATPYDQSVLIEVRNKLAALRRSLDPNQRAYPQFTAFDYTQNFYLAVAVMRIPLDGRTDSWLHQGAIRERPFAWPKGSGIDPLLGDDPAKRPAKPFEYAHVVRLRTEYPLVELSPGVFSMRRPAVLRAEVVLKHPRRFRLATDLSGRKGEVSFGIQAYDEATGRLIERRSVFERVKTPAGEVLRTEFNLADLPPSVSRVDIGPVQDYVTWFHHQSPASLRRIVFAPGWVQRGAREGAEFTWPPDADATPVATGTK